MALPKMRKNSSYLINISYLDIFPKAVYSLHVNCHPNVRGTREFWPFWKHQPDFQISPDLAFQPADNTPASKREAAERTLAELPVANIVVWTDGSFRVDQTQGGAGFVLEPCVGAPVTERIEAGLHASFYATEMTAILTAARHLLKVPSFISTEDAWRWPERCLCTDSRSALRSITEICLPLRRRMADDVRCRTATISFSSGFQLTGGLEEPQPDWQKRAAGPTPHLALRCRDGSSTSHGPLHPARQLLLPHRLVIFISVLMVLF